MKTGGRHAIALGLLQQLLTAELGGHIRADEHNAGCFFRQTQKEIVAEEGVGDLADGVVLQLEGESAKEVVVGFLLPQKAAQTQVRWGIGYTIRRQTDQGQMQFLQHALQKLKFRFVGHNAPPYKNLAG